MGRGKLFFVFDTTARAELKCLFIRNELNNLEFNRRGKFMSLIKIIVYVLVFLMSLMFWGRFFF